MVNDHGSSREISWKGVMFLICIMYTPSVISNAKWYFLNFVIVKLFCKVDTCQTLASDVQKAFVIRGAVCPNPKNL